MRKTLSLTGVLILVLAGACAADGSEQVDEDCPCLQGNPSGTGIPEILLETTSTGQLEWVCETYRQVVCARYGTEPCTWCLVPCQLGCSSLLAFPNPYAAAALFTACLGACIAECPKCEYCSRYEIEEVIVCGWVIVE